MGCISYEESGVAHFDRATLLQIIDSQASEIERLTKERDEARQLASAYADGLQAVKDDFRGLKMELRDKLPWEDPALTEEEKEQFLTQLQTEDDRPLTQDEIDEIREAIGIGCTRCGHYECKCDEVYS